jgi:hypothetical protein
MHETRFALSTRVFEAFDFARTNNSLAAALTLRALLHSLLDLHCGLLTT